MECAKIREFLSEYIDGTLDAQNKALVEAHLLACKGCEEDLASLKAVVKELGTLESVEAPEDFLEKIHERIEPRFKLGKIMQKLFFPLRIKIPLQFATATVMAILIFSFLYIQQPEKQIVDMREGLKHVKMAKKAKVDIAKGAPEKEAYKPKSVFEKTTVHQSIKERKIIELALLLKTRAPSITYAPDTVMEAIPAPKKKARAIEEEETYKGTIPRTRADRLKAPDAKMKTGVLKEEKQAMALPGRKMTALKDEIGLSSSYLDDILSRVKNLIDRVDGKVISVEYDKHSEQPQSITGDIPAKNYNSFWRKLKELAPLQAPPPAIPEKDQKVIQIRIRFISSK